MSLIVKFVAGGLLVILECVFKASIIIVTSAIEVC